MSKELNADLVRAAKEHLKMAFTTGPGGGAPMPPAGGGMQAPPPMPPAAGGPPPAMPPGGAPPMDPSMMGGAPPMGGAMPPGAPPMDPSMMGGAPPAPPPGGGGEMGGPVMVNMEDLMQLFAMIAQELGGAGGGDVSAPNEGGADLAKSVSKLSDKVDAIAEMLGMGGGGGEAVPPGEAGAAPPAPEIPPGLMEAMAPSAGGAPVPMGAPAGPMMPPPLPGGMGVSAADEAQQQVKMAGVASKVARAAAALRRRS